MGTPPEYSTKFARLRAHTPQQLSSLPFSGDLDPTKSESPARQDKSFSCLLSHEPNLQLKDMTLEFLIETLFKADTISLQLLEKKTKHLEKVTIWLLKQNKNFCIEQLKTERIYY